MINTSAPNVFSKVMNSAYPWLKKCANTRKYSAHTAHICQSIVVASYSKDQLGMLQWHMAIWAHHNVDTSTDNDGEPHT